MKDRANVILITADSLRADHLGFMGYSKAISANLDSLAGESSVFNRAYAAGPVTPHAFPAILTSTYPFDYHGVRAMDRPRVLISEVFKENGFLTAAFQSNTYVSNFFGYNKGWDFFEDIAVPYEKPEGSLKYGKAEMLFNRFLKEPFKKLVPRLSAELFFRLLYLKYRLENADMNFKTRAEVQNLTVKDFLSSAVVSGKPFFIWIHYMDTHLPYISRENRSVKDNHLSFLELACSNFGYIASHFYFEKRTLPASLLKFGRKYLKQAIDLYDQEIEYLDSQIGDLFAFLKESNLYDNSIICFTADHGDEFLEHNGGSHFQKLYNELLHVPLLIKGRSQQYSETINKKVSMVDLPSTLCDLSGIKSPAAFKGKNLFHDERPLLFHQTSSDTKGGKYYVFGFNKLEQCKIGCQSERWKYIMDYGKNIEELYDLSEDPHEQKNLINLKPEVAARMRDAIQQFNHENPPFSLLAEDKAGDASRIKI